MSRAWKFGADVDTDQLAPGPAMKHGLDQIARHCLETVRPEFARGVRPGDVIVAGPHFGIGSSREQAASVAERAQAEREGIVHLLEQAGATFLPSACGACAGYGGAIPEGSRVISSTARNFKGRMGSTTAEVFLGSPYTVAASALRGRISDARAVLA